LPDISIQLTSARAFAPEGIEGQVHHVARSGSACARGPHGSADGIANSAGKIFCQRLLQACSRTEMVQQIGMGAVDPRCHCLQCYRLRPRLYQQFARRHQSGRAADFRRQPLPIRLWHAT